MADSTPALPETPTEVGTYRPLAGLALASIAIAGLYAIVVTAFALMAIIGGNPVFLSPWALACPIVAVILAAAARWQIRNSEGARSGLALANWAWWLGIIFGVVHAAIFFGTLLAIWTQARGELEKNFLAKIEQGNLEEAFQFTLDPDQRAPTREIRERFLSMEGGKKGPLARFKDHEIVRIIQGAGEDLHTESMGIKDMPDLSGNGYGIVLPYRITTPEGVYVIQFTLRSKDSKESRKRRWRVIMKDTDTQIVSRELTPLGEKMVFWQSAARDFAHAWLMQRTRGAVESAYLATCQPQDRNARHRQYQIAMMVNTLASGAAALGDGGQSPPLGRFAAFLDANLGCELCMPGFQRFAMGDFLDETEFESPRKYKVQILDEFHKNFLRSSVMGIRPNQEPGSIRRVSGESPHLEALITVELAVLETDGPPAPKFVGQGEVVVVSDRMPESEAGMPQWRVASLKLISGSGPPSGPGGPPGKMPGIMGGQADQPKSGSAID
jgi:hypothetical protein